MMSFVVLAGCASTPVPVTRVMVGGELHTNSSQPQEVAACSPSRRISVVDSAGLPVSDARIDVEQRVSEHAIEETLAVWSYRAVSAHTDEQGKALICDPASLSRAPRSSMAMSMPMDGIAGGSSYRDGAIVVVARGQQVVLRPPFAKELKVVVEGR